ncbi:MAG: nuclear transport factor 2 family protein [Pseudomonadota bacterium]
MLRALVLGVALGLATPVSAGGHLTELGQAVAEAWVATFARGDADEIAATLAPAFQIQRASGAGHVRDTYIAQSLPSIRPGSAPEISDMVATGDETRLVLRYTLQVDEVIDGSAVTRRAPRLTVFERAENGQWQAVAHANFAVPE